jgi:uncharacterized protein (TIGR02996 family)
MQFPYKAIFLRSPAIALGGRWQRPRPIVCATLIGPTDSRLQEGLLDTGADDTVFPHSLAALIGVDLRNAPFGQSSTANRGLVTVRGLLAAIVEYGSDPSVRLIFADWLEEHDRAQEAELMRLHVALLATCSDPDHHPERVQQQTRLVELLAAGVRPCVPRQTIALAKGVDMTFA